MKVLIGFSDMPAPLGILHNVEEVENKGEKNIINIFFKSKDEAEKKSSFIAKGYEAIHKRI